MSIVTSTVTDDTNPTTSHHAEPATGPSTGSTSTMTDLTFQLTRTDLDRDQRLTRLQGWRGDAAAAADRAKWVQRLASTGCAVGALVGGILGSPALVAFMAATALIGAFAPNHPLEMVYNRAVRDTSLPALPANRAAKRLACAIGTVHLGTAAALLALGYTTAGSILAISFGLIALFVATTGICVPSIMFTLLFGSERGTAPSLAAAFRP